jgi:hypothetical protein
MTSELKALLVEGGASHAFVVVAEEQEVRAQEWLPALNAVGAELLQLTTKLARSCPANAGGHHCRSR